MSITQEVFLERERLKGCCNPATVTLTVATDAQRKIVMAALDSLVGLEILEQELGPVALVERLTGITQLPMQRIAGMLRDRGYTMERVRFDKRPYNLWVAPGCRFPKVELEKLLRQEKHHVDCSRA